jgi:hypothetical protein
MGENISIAENIPLIEKILIYENVQWLKKHQ